MPVRFSKKKYLLNNSHSKCKIISIFEFCKINDRSYFRMRICVGGGDKMSLLALNIYKKFIHRSWSGSLKRCLRPKKRIYRYYGGQWKIIL